MNNTIILKSGRLTHSVNYYMFTCEGVIIYADSIKLNSRFNTMDANRMAFSLQLSKTDHEVLAFVTLSKEEFYYLADTIAGIFISDRVNALKGRKKRTVSDADQAPPTEVLLNDTTTTTGK